MQICSVSPNKPLTFMLRSNMRNLTSYKPNNFVNCGIGRENETAQKKKKPITRFLSLVGVFVCPCYGAAGRTRTDTVSLPPDFESGASANFTTTANAIAKLYYHNREQFAIVERHIL